MLAGISLSQVAFWPSSFPYVSVSDASAGAWEGDLLLLAVTEEDFVTESESQQICHKGKAQVLKNTAPTCLVHALDEAHGRHGAVRVRSLVQPPASQAQHFTTGSAFALPLALPCSYAMPSQTPDYAMSCVSA